MTDLMSSCNSLPGFTVDYHQVDNGDTRTGRWMVCNGDHTVIDYQYTLNLGRKMPLSDETKNPGLSVGAPLNRAVLRVSSSLLIGLLSTGSTIDVTVVDGLPDDCRLVRVLTDWQDGLAILLESSEFADMVDGQYPEVQLIFQSRDRTACRSACTPA